MTDWQADLSDIITRFSPEDGFHDLPVPGTHCIKISQPRSPAKQRWPASLSVVVQGCKEIRLGSEVYRYGEAHYVATPIDLPVASRVVSAAPAAPFLCLNVDIDPLTLSEVAANLGSASKEKEPVRAVFIEKASALMLDTALRLGKLCLTPEDAPALGPLVTKELLYHLLKGPDGPAIRQFVRAGSSTHKIAQAIYSLKTELDQEIDVGSLAQAANMSRSAFFRHFKEVTAMSPVQYQKRLRLLEARRLMSEAGETAEGAAFKVGYNSASQFSREYSRMFGNAPLRDAMKMKATGEPIHQM